LLVKEQHLQQCCVCVDKTLLCIQLILLHVGDTMEIRLLSHYHINVLIRV